MQTLPGCSPIQSPGHDEVAELPEAFAVFEVPLIGIHSFAVHLGHSDHLVFPC